MCGHPVFLAAYIEEAVFSSSYVLGCFVKYQLAVDAWVYISLGLLF
jgi:hypothetical protein